MQKRGAIHIARHAPFVGRSLGEEKKEVLRTEHLH